MTVTLAPDTEVDYEQLGNTLQSTVKDIVDPLDEDPEITTIIHETGARHEPVRCIVSLRGADPV